MFKDEINRLMEIKGMSKREMANELNISYGAMLRYCTGETIPNLKKLVEISAKYGIPLDKLT